MMTNLGQAQTERFEVWDTNTNEVYVVHRIKTDTWSVSIKKCGKHIASYVTDDRGAHELYTTLKRSA